MSYAELNARANVVAHRLRTLGVGPGLLVAVCVPRSPALLVVLLGIQKSGGAYVPLDPDYPTQRLEYMLADSGATVLVTAGYATARSDIPTALTLSIWMRLPRWVRRITRPVLLRRETQPTSSIHRDRPAGPKALRCHMDHC